MGEKGVRSLKYVGSNSCLPTSKVNLIYVHPIVVMDIRLMTNVHELVTMLEERIVEEQNGRSEKGAYASARNVHLGCIHHSKLPFARVV